MKNKIDTLDIKHLKEMLPPRERGAHKGDFGHVLIVGGNKGMAGAVVMAAMAAGRVGAGLVSVATLPAHVAAVVGDQPEVMCRGVEEEAELDELMRRATVVAIGPGLGQGPWADRMMDGVLKYTKPLVVDADGLTWLGTHPSQRDNWVLTPHVGEGARLLGTTPDLIQQDRVGSAKEIVARFGGVCVLKGKGTVVCGGEEDRPSVCDKGNPGMASGGMGDILTGVIAGLIAQGLSLRDAANVGVWVHGTAGDMAVVKEGERGLLATDLLPHIRKLVNP